MPAIASAGSVVALPSAFTAQVPGIASPAFSAIRILPIAASLVAMSSTIGAGPSDGTAIAIGLFPTTRSAPPGAGISGRVLHITMPIQSSAAAFSAKRRAVPKWKP
jgi:hypothetical protein